jgi:hypothetical protein
LLLACPDLVVRLVRLASTMMRALVAVAAQVLLLAGCVRPGDSRECAPITSAADSGSDPAEGFPVAGAVLRLVLALPVACTASVMVQAKVGVLDPDNMPVPLLEGEPSRTADRLIGQVVSTTLVIRPERGGTYHFIADFDRNLGRVQTDVVVAEDRGDAGPDLVLSDGVLGCTHLDVSPKGRLLCLSGIGRVMERDGSLVQSFPGPAARIGSIVWAVDGSGNVSRWREDDAGFVIDPDAGVQPEVLPVPFAAPVLLAPSEGDLFYASGLTPVVYRVWAADGGLQMRDYLHLGTEVPRALWRSDQELTVLRGIDASVSICTWQSDMRSTCVELTNEEPLASEGTGLWTVATDRSVSPPTQVLSVWQGSNARTLALPDAWSAQSSTVVPGIDTGAWIKGPAGRTMLVRRLNGEIIPQAFPELEVLSATGTWVALRGQDNSVRLYRR